ncbi:MAG: MATE family efflux transporter [Sphaerochaetaceae bacterium]|jgi:putative MATE family efflux protein
MGQTFSWKPFLANTAAIAIPVALQNLLSTTGSMVDTVMLASLGETTIGAVGLCAQFSSLMFSCYWGFVGGGMLFFAQYWGARDEEGITRSYGITLTFMMTVAAIFTVLSLRFPRLAISIYTDKPAIQEIGASYLRIVGYAYPLQILVMAMSALLRSMEKVRIPLYGGIAAVLTNFVANYLLIFGKLGLPKLGVRGAAIGTVIASLVNLLVVCTFVWKRKIPFVFSFRKHFRWNRRMLSLYLGKCFPIICNELFIGFGNMCITMVLGRQTEEAIAALAVFRTFEGVIISFFSGFSNAATVLIGTKVGEGDLESAYQRGIRLVYLVSAFTGFVCLTLVLVHTPLLHAMGLGEISFRYGSGMLYIFSLVALLRMGNWAQNDTFRSAGDPAFGSIMEITFMYLLVLPTVYYAGIVRGVPFLLLFALCYIDEPIRYIIMQRHLYSGKWIKPVSLVGKEKLAEFRKMHELV